jgi:membrane protein YqaA with SNARE-associated domain
MPQRNRQTVARVVALVVVIGLSLAIIAIPPEQAQRLQGYGYPGIFILSLLANATLLLPAPALLVVFSLGAQLSPIGIAFAAGSGATIGELSGYLAGFSGQAVIENNRVYDRLVGWMRKHGNLTVLVLAFLPNPFFDLTGIAAGALRMPLAQFLFWCFLGTVAKMFLVAAAGAGAFNIPFINQWLRP